MNPVTLVPASQADRRDLVERVIAQSTQEGFFGDNETPANSPWPGVIAIARDDRAPCLIVAEGGVVGYMVLDAPLPSAAEIYPIQTPLVLEHIEIYADARRKVCHCHARLCCSAAADSSAGVRQRRHRRPPDPLHRRVP